MNAVRSRRVGDAAALAAALLLGGLPLCAGLAELVVEPAALSELLGERLLRLWGQTVTLGLCTALASLLVGGAVGWTLAHCRGTGWLAALLPVPLILPPWIAGVAWSEATSLAGFWGAVFLLTASLWPLVALFALRGFRTHRRATEVAVLARGRGAAFRRVELPLALPSLLSGALLVFVFATTDFGVVDFLSFSTKQPFVVLSSEIFQKWSHIGSGVGAAVASLPALCSSIVALLLILRLEARHAGRHRGPAPPPAHLERLGAPRLLALLLLLLLMAVPVVVMAGWTLRGKNPLASVAAHRDAILTSLGVALASGLVVALLGVRLARLTLRPGRGGLLLLVLLLPLAAPAVTFAVGEVRLWNHPWNPLADAVYPSTLLLVLALAGRFLPLGVLAARALLLRQDESPLLAAQLVARPAWQRWWHVELPLLAPATGLAFTLGFLLALRELDIMVLVPAGSRTLAHVIFGMVHIGSDAVTAALCLTLLLLVLVPAIAARLLGVPGVDCEPGTRAP